MDDEEKNKYKLEAIKRRDHIRVYEEGGGKGKSSANNNIANMKKSLKKTSQGKYLVDVFSEEQHAMNMILQRKRYIEDLIQQADDNNALDSLVFYIIHTTTYLADDYHAEIGICKFSLKNGVISSIHMFIDHDELPTGFVHDAQDRYEREHHIALPPYQNKILKPLKDYKNAFFEIRNFLNVDSSDGNYHLYTLPDQFASVENLFKECSKEITDPYIPQKFVVHDYMDLFFYLMKKCYKNDRTDAIYKSSIRDIVIRDVHDMLKSLCCDYHYEVDALHCCSLSKAKRWAHYICEECCNELNIYMINGVHFPQESNMVQNFPSGRLPKEDPDGEASSSGHGHIATGVVRKPVSQIIQPAQPRPRRPPQNRNVAWTSISNNGMQQPRFPAPRYPQGPAFSASPVRNGTTAACMKLSRGGCKMPSRDYKSSSDEELDFPHNDSDYANVVKPWEVALSAQDVDPTILKEDNIEPDFKNLNLEQLRETKNRNSWPKRGNIAANFDRKME